MLRLGNHIRLTGPEIAKFTEITTFAPEGVKTLADLDAHIARCKQYYWGATGVSLSPHASCTGSSTASANAASEWLLEEILH